MPCQSKTAILSGYLIHTGKFWHIYDRKASLFVFHEDMLPLQRGIHIERAFLWPCAET